MGGVSDEVLLARAYLSRVAEPTCIPLWRDVERYGPVEVVAALRRGDSSPELLALTSGRAKSIEPHADLEAADRHGARLICPESDEWPHSTFAALERTGRERLARYEAGDRHLAYGGELIPPLALWVRGAADPRGLGYRTAAVVGARSATAYGESVARNLAYGLAERDFEIVSGGAHGIDTAVHRGALAADGVTVIVSAGGVDSVYPPANRRLFEQAAERGLIMSECPPGTAPHRGRFLTRNRIIAALATGTVVVEAADRSGALNTAGHCRGLGRVLMAVPGPITSAMSAGCHALLAARTRPAALVTGVDDVVDLIGSSSDLALSIAEGEPAAAQRPHDNLDHACRRVLDGFPARGYITVDRLIVTCGAAPSDVFRALPQLEMLALVHSDRDGRYRLARADRTTATSS